jgi:uncharacterized membrane protein
MSEIPPPPGGGSYTPPPSPTGGSAGGSDRTLMIALSYLWILALIPLLTKKEDREIQWHAKNGLAILVAEVACWLLFTVLSFVIPSGSMMGCGVMTTIQCAVWIAFLVVRIVCIVKGVNGQRFRVPVISDFADKF